MKFFKNIIWILILSGLLSPSQKIVRVYAPSWEIFISSLKGIFGKNIPEIVSGKKNVYYDLILSDNDFSKIKATGLKVEVIIEDLESLKEIYRGQYHSYTEVRQILRNLANSNPGIAKLESIGPSYEGRWIYGLKISDNVQIDEDEPEHLFSGCIHAREWASVEVALFIADSLISAYGIDPNITQIVNTREIWVFPIKNPDGYVYDYPAQNSWRKNRQPFHGYIGTDLNRNYNGTGDTLANAGWGWIAPGGSASHNPGSETFCGFKGFSGPEIYHEYEFVKNRTFNTSIDYHSYGEIVLMPWGYLIGPTPHDEWMQELASGYASRVHKLGGGTYEYDYALYPVTGNARDFFYGWNNFVNGNPCVAFVVEVGTAFYQPATDLDYICRENFKGAFYLLRKGDSIRNYMTCWVPAPRIEPLDTVSPDFMLIWHPKNRETNDPIYWEIERYQNPQPILESFESGTNLWVLENFSLSTARKHSGNYSLYSGNQNNIQAQARTKYPYFVRPGDSLKFWAWYSLENEYDVAIVEVSEDGRDWYPLVSERYNSSSGGWLRYAYSLAPWVGKSLYFRWRVMTDDNVLNEGFYIDDVYPVSKWGNIQTVATQIYDTLYNFTGVSDGTYYFRVRGYNSQFGFGNWSILEEVVVSSTKVAEKNIKEGFPLRVSIYDITGRRVKSLNFDKISDYNRKIDLNLSGIFIIKANGGKKKIFVIK